MRFLTEFVLKYPYGLDVLDAYKLRHQLDIGNQVGSAFDWDSSGNDEAEKFRLEVEAFPMDKWIEFRNQLLREVDLSSADSDYVRLLLITLESFGSKKEPLV